MEFTGELYGFYSNKAIPTIFEYLKNYAESINLKFPLFMKMKISFFFKDEAMLHEHDEKGYNTALNGEGCFCIEAKKTTLNGIATLFEFEGKSDFDPTAE